MSTQPRTKQIVVFFVGLLIAVAMWLIMRAYFGEALTITTLSGDLILVVGIFTVAFFGRRFLSK